MIDLKDTPLKRGIPNTRFYIELHPGYMEIKVRGSKMAGVKIEYLVAASDQPPPGSAPAKCSDGLDYLMHVVKTQERRKEKAIDKPKL